VVKLSKPRASAYEIFLFSELMYPDGGLQIAQVVLEPAVNDLVIPFSLLGITVPRIFADAVQAQDLHSLIQLLVMSDDHTAFPGRKVFRRVKTEADGVTSVSFLGMPSAYWMTFVLRADCMRRIFDHEQSIIVGKTPDCIHVTRQPSNMYGDNRARPLSHLFNNRFGIDVA